MLLFYMEDDEEVNKLNPHYEALAEHVANVDDLIIGKYNVRTNQN